MATTYVSTKAGTGTQPRLDVHDDTIYCEFDIAAAVGTAANGGGGAGAAAFVINDVVQMIKVQAGTVIVAAALSCDALESNAAIVTALGDGVVDDRFITGATIGRSSVTGFQGMNNHAGHLFLYTTDDTIDFKVKTAGTAGQATTGKIRASVRITPQQ